MNKQQIALERVRIDMLTTGQVSSDTLRLCSERNISIRNYHLVHGRIVRKEWL